MNRLQAGPASSSIQSASSIQHDVSTAPFTTSATEAAASLKLVESAPDRSLAPATTFMPIHYERGYAYPLLVWLHGEGQSDADLPQVMQHVSLRNYVATAPRGERVGAGDQGSVCLGWHASHKVEDMAEQRIADAIAQAQDRFNVRPDRIFLAGIGAGGTTALRVGLADPQRFAGVASFGGPMPVDGRPLRSVTRCRELPLMLVASSESAAYPQEHVCRDLRLLHTAGCQVNVRLHPGDDDLTTTMLSDLDRWMMEIVCG